MLGLVLLAVAGRSPSPPDIGPADIGPVDTVEQRTDEPLPAPILLEGTPLRQVSFPANPAFDVDGLFEPDRDPAADARWAEETALDSTFRFDEAVYALDPADPSGPVAVVITDNGTQVAAWTLNTGPQDGRLLRFNGDDSVVLANGDELQKVWRLSDTPVALRQSAWSFEFGPELPGISLTAEPVGLSIWSVLSRNEFAPEGGTLVPTQIPGVDRPGYRLQETGSPLGMAIWADDQFVYSLASWDPEVSLDELLAQVRLVEQEVWVEQVGQAERYEDDNGLGPYNIIGPIMVAVVMLLPGLPAAYRWLFERGSTSRRGSAPEPGETRR